MKGLCEYLREKTDLLFGEGTSEKCFGKSMDLNIFEQFFEGIVPIIREAREEKLKKYLKASSSDKKASSSDKKEQ